MISNLHNLRSLNQPTSNKNNALDSIRIGQSKPNQSKGGGGGASEQQRHEGKIGQAHSSKSQSFLIFPHARPIKRRRRLTAEETRYLQEAFCQNQRPNSENRSIIANKLGLSTRAIQIWFQNRRAKEKKDGNEGTNGKPVHPKNSAKFEPMSVDGIFHAYKPPIEVAEKKEMPIESNSNSSSSTFSYFDSSSESLSMQLEELFGNSTNSAISYLLLENNKSESLQKQIDSSPEFDILLAPRSPSLQTTEKFYSERDKNSSSSLFNEILHLNSNEQLIEYKRTINDSNLIYPAPIQPSYIVDSFDFENLFESI